MERRRSQLLGLLADGRTYLEALDITKYSYQGADKIIDAYHKQGLDALPDKRHKNCGAPSLLSDAQLLWLARVIRAEKESPWNGRRVQQVIVDEFGIEVHLSRCYEYLKTIGYSKQQPRPKHVKSDPHVQEEFKKNPSRDRK